MNLSYPECGRSIQVIHLKPYELSPFSLDNEKNVRTKAKSGIGKPLTSAVSHATLNPNPQTLNPKP